MATLADARLQTLDTLPDVEALYSPASLARQRTGEIANSGQFMRGWNSAGLGGDANSLWTQAAKAGDLDPERRATLEAQARDLDRQTAQWAPTVKNFTDIKGLRSGADWAAGAMGNLRTSVAPALAGLGGFVAGHATAPLTAGVVNPATLGFAAASAAGYDTETDEAVASAMRDPYIRANHSYEEILAASRVKGGLNAMLEAAVPAVMGGKLLGQGAKAVVGKGFAPAAAHVAKNVGVGSAGEFATEGVQSLVGQGTQNYLSDKPVNDFDYTQAFNEGMAGAVAGGGMGVVGGGADVAHARLGESVDKVKDIASDPLSEAAYAAGKKMAPKPEASVYDKILSGEVSPKDALVKGGDAETNQRAAEAHALSVLNNPDASEQERTDAVEFKNSVLQNPEGATNLYRDKLTIDHHETKQGKTYADIIDEINRRTEPKTKASKMRASMIPFGDNDPTSYTYDEAGRATEQGGDPVDLTGKVSPQNTKLGGTVSPGEKTRSAYLGVEAKRLAGQATASQIGQPNQPKGPGVTGAKLQQLETVADIWRKQGVDDKLLKATSDKTEGAQRAMAISVLGWVQRGFKDYDGNIFVPEALTRAHKGKSAQMIRKAVELAQGEGLIDAETAAQLPEIERMATAQYAENNHLIGLVAGALRPSLREKGVDAEQIRSILPDLTRIAVHGARGEGTTKGGTTRGQYGVSETRSATDKDALVALFGSEDNALPVLAKLYERAKGSKPELRMDKEVDENDGEDSGSDNLDYEDRQSANEVSSKAPTYSGYGKDNVPYDTQDAYQKGYLAEHTAKGASTESKRSVGVWQRIKDQFADDPEALYDAETALLDEHGHDYLKHAQREAMEEYGVSAGTAINEAPPLVRKTILGKIDQRFKLIRTEVMNDGDTLEFTSEDFSKLGLIGVGFGKQSKGNEVVSTGKLILERADVKTNYVTSAPMIIARMFDLKDTATNSNSEREAGSASARLDMLAQGLMSFATMENKDGSLKFTGRVGYVTEAGGEITWMKKNDPFPAELPLDGARKHTVADATKQAETRLQRGEDKYAKVGLATTQVGMEKELRTLMDAPETSKKFAYVIKQAVEEGGKAVRDLYQDLRNDTRVEPNDLVEGNRHQQPQGSNIDRENSSVPRSKDTSRVSRSVGNIAEDGKTSWEAREKAKAKRNGDTAKNTDRVASENDVVPGPDTPLQEFGTLREDGAHVGENAPIQREDNSMTKGGAAGYNLTGSSRVNTKNGKRVTESKPRATGVEPVVTKTKVGSVDAAAQWAFDTIRKGMPAFGAALKKMSFEQKDTLERGLKQLSSMGVQGVIDNLAEMTKKEAAQILLYASNAVLHLQKRAPLTEGVSLKTSQGANDVTADTNKSGSIAGTADKGVAGESGRGDALGRPASAQESNDGDKTRTGASAELGTKETLDDAIYNEDYSKLDTAEKLLSFARYVNQRSAELEALESERELTKKEEGVSALGGQLVFDAKSYLKKPDSFTGMDFESFFDGVEHSEADVDAFIKALAGSKKNAQYQQDTGYHEAASIEDARAYARELEDAAEDAKQIADAALAAAMRKKNAQAAAGKAATNAERDAAAKHLTDTLGDTIERSFKPFFKDGSSGVWQKGATKNVIRLALNGDVLGTAYHESMHELMSILRKHGGTDVQQFMQRVATQGLVMKKLEQLLAHHPEALDQLADPEEAAAYMYQFWSAGMLKLGPQATTLFEKIKHLLARIFGKVGAEIKDQQHAETIMRGFTSGDFKDGVVHQAAVEALMKDTSRHEAALARVGENYKKFADVAGKFVYSAEGMMESTRNADIVGLAELFNQKAGAAMKSGADFVGTFFDAMPQMRSQYMNKLENILQKPDIDKADIELIREALATDTPSHIPRIQKIVEQMHGLNDELMRYAVSRNVSKLNEKTGDWEKMTSRKDFGMPQIWDVEVVQNNPQGLKDDLLATHAKELAGIARKANVEALSQIKDVQQTMGPAAQAEYDRALAEFKASGKIMAPLNLQEITPEMVADAIVARIMNTGGDVGPAETSSNLGITPLAASVNKRSLSWIDKKVFDKYKQKDLIAIYSTYIVGMTKRGEYTARFGPGGEEIRDRTDRAFLREMGGKALVEQATRELPLRIKQWAKDRDAAMKSDQDFNEPRPTLRSVGSHHHGLGVSAEQFANDAQKAAKALYHATRAVQAMEGTLGIDISPGLRTLNGILITYQSLRLLSASLFTSMSDVVGITLNGGTMKDAWGAFVRGMREVKLSAWDNDKSVDEASRRAELWGSVDAVSFNEAISQGYSGMFLSGKAKRFSDTFFRKIGMEGWNRAMRIHATIVGERVITDWARGKIDMSDKAALARIERLFGEGATSESIKVNADGTLDTGDVKNQAAITRFVNDSVLRPNASQRTVWGSDPHYAALWHLKSYTWTQHKVIIEAIIEQAKLGNYRPAMVGLVGYTPVAIAAGAMKEMLIPGDEPPWMQGGLGSYLQYGFDRSGLGGIPTALYGNLKDPASWFGPAVDEAQGFASIPFMDNHTLAQETLGALPFGNILRRAAG